MTVRRLKEARTPTGNPLLEYGFKCRNVDSLAIAVREPAYGTGLRVHVLTHAKA